jgi:hypothetical protein
MQSRREMGTFDAIVAAEWTMMLLTLIGLRASKRRQVHSERTLLKTPRWSRAVKQYPATQRRSEWS